MSFIELVYFVLSAYGLTQILCYGRIFNRIRPKGYFWSCPMCVGFWVGMFLCVINPLTQLFMFEVTVANIMLCGFISSGTSYTLSMVFGDSGINLETKNVTQEMDDSRS